MAITAYWVAPSPANWNASLNNWASSSGGTGGTAANIPGAGDTAIFDSGSSQTCTISATLTVTNITMQTNFAGIITQSNPLQCTGTLTINGGTFTENATIGATTPGAISMGGGTFTGGANQKFTSFSMTSGTYTGGSGPTQFTTWSNSGGSFTSTSGTMTITGATWTLSGTGTFTHNSGTINQTTTSITITPNGCTFNNLSLTFGNNNFATGSTCYIAGNLNTTSTNTINNSTAATVYLTGNYTCGASAGCELTVILNASSGTQTIAYGSGNAQAGQITLAQTGTAGITFTGPIEINNWTTTSQGSGAVTQTGNVTFAFLNSVTCTPGTFVFPGNCILNTAGNVTISGTLYIGGNFTFTAVNQITGGTIAVAGNYTYNATSRGGTYTTRTLLNGNNNTQTIGGTGSISWPSGTFEIQHTGTGSVQLGINLLLNTGQTLDVNSGIFDLVSYNLSTASGTVTLNIDASGQLNLQGGQTFTNITMGTFAAGSIVNYYGTSGYSALLTGYSYKNLMFTGAGTWTLPTLLTIGKNLTINSSAVVKFLASSTQSITGNTIFSNCTIGSSTPGTTTTLAVSGTSTWNTVTVSDIHNTKALIRANLGSIRGNGNTTGIVFNYEDQMASMEF